MDVYVDLHKERCTFFCTCTLMAHVHTPAPTAVYARAKHLPSHNTSYRQHGRIFLRAVSHSPSLVWVMTEHCGHGNETDLFLSKDVTYDGCCSAVP